LYMTDNHKRKKPQIATSRRILGLTAALSEKEGLR